MDITLIKSFIDLGVPVAILCFIGWLVVKYAPQFVKAFSDLTHSIDRNTEITGKHFEKTVTVIDQLRDVVKRLDSNDINIQTMRTEHNEIIKLLQQIKDMVNGEE